MIQIIQNEKQPKLTKRMIQQAKLNLVSSPIIEVAYSDCLPIELPASLFAHWCPAFKRQFGNSKF